jgi:hypothetical protein
VLPEIPMMVAITAILRYLKPAFDRMAAARSETRLASSPRPMTP